MRNSKAIIIFRGNDIQNAHDNLGLNKQTKKPFDITGPHFPTLENTCYITIFTNENLIYFATLLLFILNLSLCLCFSASLIYDFDLFLKICITIYL